MSHEYALVLIFSDLFSDPDALLNCFQHLRFRKHDVAVFQVMHPDEIRFPFERPTRFEDMEEPGSVLAEPGLIRDRYRQALDEFLEQIRRGCLEFQVDYRLLTTEDDFEKVLADFLLARLRH